MTTAARTTLPPAEPSPPKINKISGDIVPLLILGTMVFAYLWAIAGMVSLAWLAYSVPILDSDITHATLLEGKLTIWTFVAIVGSGAVLFGTVIGACHLSNKLKTNVPVVLGVILCAGMFAGHNQTSTTQIGLLDGTVRIGCFVSESLECKEKLGLPTEGASSGLVAKGTLAAEPWFLAKQANSASPGASSRLIFHRFLGGILLRAPLYLGSADGLRELLEKQRQEVADLQKVPSR